VTVFVRHRVFPEDAAGSRVEKRRRAALAAAVQILLATFGGCG